VIMICKSPELKSKLAETRAQYEASYRQWQAYQGNNQPDMARAQWIKVQADKLAYDDAQRRFDELTIKSPIDGYLVAPEIEQLPGTFKQVGEEMCIVQETDQLRVRGTVSQEDRQLLGDHVDFSQRTDLKRAEIRPVGNIGTVLFANSYWVTPGADRQVPHPALTSQGGGEVQPDPKDQSGMKSANPEFELRVDLSNPNNEYVPGQRAYVP